MSVWHDLRQRLRESLPTPQELEKHRWLAPIAHRLSDRGLWHANTESIARGVAIGLFWAFAVPVAQIVFAVAHCVWWRANIPVAAAITFITNPLTIGGWLYLAYRVGSVFVAPDADALPAEGWLAQLRALGWPTVVGMALFATGGAAAGYLLVRLVSGLWVHYRYVRRLTRRYRPPER